MPVSVLDPFLRVTRRHSRVGAVVIAMLLASLLLVAPSSRSGASVYSANDWTTSGSAPTSRATGTDAVLAAKVTSATKRTALVSLEVYDAAGTKAFQQVWDNQVFRANRSRSLKVTWAIPASAVAGAYSVKIGVFAPGWAALQHWNDDAASMSVTSSATTTTAPVSTTTTAPPTSTTIAPTTTTTSAPTTTTTALTTTTTTAPAPTTTTAPPPSSGLPALPAAWPASFELGSADEPGGAAALKQRAPYAFRYQYLAGGVNTGTGWANWNTNGDFARYYIEDSRAAGIIPVFSYYQIYQSSPGNSMGETSGVFANLGNAATMTAYYNDLKLFFQKAGVAGGTTVLHVEPDLWAFLQQRATNDDATTVGVMVGSSGQADVVGLPNDAAGFAQAIVKLRDRYAPNVLLGYHFSTWATGNDFIYSDPSDATVESLGVRTGRFAQSLGARWDVAFTDLADRDAAFRQLQYGDTQSWYDAGDYRRSAVFIKAFVRTANLRAVIWQIPLGNTRMRAQNNTWNHYQDNKVEWLLDDATRAQMRAYADAGVVALLFGRGADGPTCACDANGDGVTNPAPINGNDRESLNADDDGGFFLERTRAYYAGGRLGLA